MLTIVFIVFKLVFVAVFLALAYSLLAGMFALIGLLFKVGEAALGTDDNTVVTVYPVPVEGKPSGIRRSDVTDQRSSNFFEDVRGVDLEYRGVGVAQALGKPSVFGQNVQTGSRRQNRSSR